MKIRRIAVHVVIFGFFSLLSHAKDTIRPKEVVGENETLISAGNVFQLGFFEDASTGNRFMGIWLKNDANKKAVWVANRDNPMLSDPSATLQIRDDGNLILLDRRQSPIIVNSGMLATSENTSATLLDSGNLVLKQGDEVVWQSFDYPTDTYLPGMKLGLFGFKETVPRIQILVSWLSPENPLRGAYTLGGAQSIDDKGATKLSVWKGYNDHLDISSWDGHNFGFLFKNSTNSFHFAYVSNENETYFSFNTIGKYDLSWLKISSIGRIDEYTMFNGTISSVSHTLCDQSSVRSSNICLNSEPSKCKDGDAFMPINASLPASMTLNLSVAFSECEFLCKRNCSCIAFASFQDDQALCQLHYGSKNELLNITAKDGLSVVYARGSASSQQGSGKKRSPLLILLSAICPLIVATIVSIWCYQRGQTSIQAVNRRKQQEEGILGAGLTLLLDLNTNNVVKVDTRVADDLELGRGNDQELPLFSFHTIETATEQFATKNKLGEGGFGPVYKGILPQGEEIAVKRLSQKSGQGVKEFKNEVKLISKLQHRNLVKLLGCCIKGEEYILIYEYMPNRSLDSFIFNSNQRTSLDWRKRLDIIEGIAQGLLYLHKYSRLRIIHRDLKASNILLDSNMNPKISDFGMARIFRENETRAKTTKIAGTYGYMSPEYAMDGLFSEKSDVFSFGIIVLEIISGKRNMAFFNSDNSLNLLGHAWNLWKEGKAMEILDSPLEVNSSSSTSVNEIVRCLQLGLLCVQDRAADRPTMSDVIYMVRNDTIVLPIPKEPSFLTQQTSTTYADSSRSIYGDCSNNEVTISEIFGR